MTSRPKLLSDAIRDRKLESKYPKMQPEMMVSMEEKLRKMVADGLSIDVSDPKQASILVQVLKDNPPAAKEIELTHPTPEVIAAVADLGMESLKVRHDQEKVSFADQGACFVKLLHTEKLTSLDLEFSKDSAELKGVLEGLKECNLHELKIGNPHGADQKKALSEALTSISSLEKLEVRNWIDGEAVNSLVNGLATRECNVSDFYFRSKFPCHEQIAKVLKLPECKLVNLGLVLSNPHLISADDSSQFSAAVETSQLKSLTLLIDASSDGDCTILQELAFKKHNFEKVQLTILNSNISNLNMKSLFTGKMESLKINTFGTLMPPDLVRQIIEAMEDQDFKIKHLAIGGDAPFSPEDSRKVVRCLEKNFKCPLESLELGDRWKDDPLGKYCEQVLDQNKIYRTATTTKVPQGLDLDKVEPTGAKLYVCGDEDVGKSTLSKNLFIKYNVLAFFNLSRENVIHLDNLNFGDKHLLICDFGGSEEFNALHHYLVKGSDKDMFLIVCKAPEPVGEHRGHLHFEGRLRYWLKFILSHRSLPDQKPRVMIVLNYFPESEHTINVDMNRDAYNRCSTVVDQFSNQVDFGSIRNNIFGIQATKPRQLQALKQQLQANLSIMLKSRPKVPKVCHTIMENVKTDQKQVKVSQKIRLACQYLQEVFLGRPRQDEHPRKRVFTVAELVSMTDMEHDFLKVCLTFLHNEGEVIFFEHHSEYVIMDVWWFAQNIIRIFVHENSMLIAEARTKLATHCDEEHYNYILFVLHHLGVILLNNVTKPTLLSTRSCWTATNTPKWRIHANGDVTSSGKNVFSFWGRRYECRDSYTLLPWGYFTVLQMKVAGLFQAYEVGGGWLYIVENDVHVIVQFGGNTGDRYERQWIDLLVRLPNAASSNEGSDALLHKIKECLLSICGAQGCAPVELEEKVIRPRSVEDLTCDEAEPFSVFMEEANTNFMEDGLVYKHSWKKHLEDSCCIYEILTLTERKHYYDDKLKRLEPIKYEVLDCLPDEVAETPISDEILTSGSDADSEFKRELSKAVAELKQYIRISEQRIIQEVQDLKVVVKKEMELLRGQSVKIIGKLKLLINFQLPKYPYFTNTDNLLQQYSREIFGKKMRLRLLCEHGTCHHIERQRGLDVNVHPEWFHRAAPVLVPALRILFVGAQILTTMYAGVKLPVPAPFKKDYMFGGVQKLTKHVFGEEAEGSRGLHKKFPTAQELEEFYREFMKTKINDQVKDMEKYFRLHPVVDGSTNQHLWVCDQHQHLYMSN